LISRLLLIALLLHATASIAWAEFLEGQPLAIVIAPGESCVRQGPVCSQLLVSQVLYDRDRVDVSNGALVIYRLDSRTRESLPASRTYRLTRAAYVAEPEELRKTRIQQLLQITPGRTASAMLRGNGGNQCSADEFFAVAPEWLGDCIQFAAERLVPAGHGLSLPQFSFYRNWPSVVLGSNHDFFLATVDRCTPLEKIDPLGDEVRYLLQKEASGMVVYGLAVLPAACASNLQVELSLLDGSSQFDRSTLERDLAKQAILLGYSLKYEALELLNFD
jgi:hypothetical protein